MQDIQQEYQNICARSGQTQYQISALKSDLDLLNKSLRDLNLEAAAIQKADAEAKAAAESKPEAAQKEGA